MVVDMVLIKIGTADLARDTFGELTKICCR